MRTFPTRPDAGHVPVVTGAPVATRPRKGGDRCVPRTTMLRCTCGWHAGQVSPFSPGNGGRYRALRAHARHVTTAGADRPGLSWSVTVEQAIHALEVGR